VYMTITPFSPFQTHLIYKIDTKVGRVELWLYCKQRKYAGPVQVSGGVAKRVAKTFQAFGRMKRAVLHNKSLSPNNKCRKKKKKKKISLTITEFNIAI